MKDIIRKLLKETKSSKENGIKNIEDTKKYIEPLLPKMVSFFEHKLPSDLFKIKIKKKMSHYGMENHSTESYILSFYFDKIESESEIEKLIIRELYNFFNVDISKYGVPLTIEIYVKTWKQVF